MELRKIRFRNNETKLGTTLLKWLNNHKAEAKHLRIPGEVFHDLRDDQGNKFIYIWAQNQKKKRSKAGAEIKSEKSVSIKSEKSVSTSKQKSLSARTTRTVIEIEDFSDEDMNNMTIKKEKIIKKEKMAVDRGGKKRLFAEHSMEDRLFLKKEWEQLGWIGRFCRLYTTDEKEKLLRKSGNEKLIKKLETLNGFPAAVNDVKIRNKNINHLFGKDYIDNILECARNEKNFTLEWPETEDKKAVNEYFFYYINSYLGQDIPESPPEATKRQNKIAKNAHIRLLPITKNNIDDIP